MLSGTPLLVMKRTWVLRVVFCFTLLPLALLFAALVGSELSSKHPDRDTAALFGILAAATFALFLWLFRRESTRQVRLLEDGVAMVDGGRSREIRWSDVKQIWFHAIRIQPGGLLGAAVVSAFQAVRKRPARLLDQTYDNITVRIVGAGLKITMNSGDRGVVAAFQEVLKRVNPRLVEESMQRVQEPRGAQFGKVSLTRAGIQLGRGKPIPYSEVEELSVTRGRLSVKKRGAWLARGGIPIKNVPNVFVLLECYERLSGRTSPAAPELRGNLVRIGV